jgi:hypothetical protein
MTSLHQIKESHPASKNQQYSPYIPNKPTFLFRLKVNIDMDKLNNEIEIRNKNKIARRIKISTTKIKLTIIENSNLHAWSSILLVMIFNNRNVTEVSIMGSIENIESRNFRILRRDVERPFLSTSSQRCPQLMGYS